MQFSAFCRYRSDCFIPRLLRPCSTSRRRSPMIHKISAKPRTKNRTTRISRIISSPRCNVFRPLSLWRLDLQPELDQAADGFGDIGQRFLFRAPVVDCVDHFSVETDDLFNGEELWAGHWFSL